MARERVSLLDLTKGIRCVEWFVVYHPREPYMFWAKWMKQGFRHVELWRPEQWGPGISDVWWLVLRPNFELLVNHIEYDPTPPWVKFPGATVQKVQFLMKEWKVRQWFHFGPVSCTEIVKFALGINKFWLRTPYQLYKYIKQRNGVLRIA